MNWWFGASISHSVCAAWQIAAHPAQDISAHSKRPRQACQRMSWSTVSKADDKSKSASSARSPESITPMRSEQTFTYSVEWPFLYADWCRGRRPAVPRYDYLLRYDTFQRFKHGTHYPLATQICLNGTARSNGPFSPQNPKHCLFLWTLSLHKKRIMRKTVILGLLATTAIMPAAASGKAPQKTHLLHETLVAA